MGSLYDAAVTRYFAIRTDRSRTAFLAPELEAGRFRQGWGYRPAHDLAQLRRRQDAGEQFDDELGRSGGTVGSSPRSTMAFNAETRCYSPTSPNLGCGPWLG